MRKLIITSLMLTPVFAMAESPKNVLVDLQYLRHGRQVCGEKKTVVDGEEYLFCEGSAEGNRHMLRFRAQIQKRNQIMLSMKIEEIDPSGKIKLLSNPQLGGTNGEESKIEMGELTGKDRVYEELEKIIVTPTIQN
ncbi:MAG: hypothetical protein ACXWQO_17525 [Bdellovibrionota bacterium]